MIDSFLHHNAPHRAHLRAFVYGDSMKPGRPEILRYPRDALARTLAELPSEEAARCLALLPAGAQIAIVTRLDRDARARLAHDCADWVGVVPILRKLPRSRSYAGQMTPLGRV
ncbi:hypothetical protein [Roseinatronobacter sp. S2]|uniref:hypothetical protein n=1 Tax=Roseinatronobacter sp. S2 TaxID=3035471 RepID=UPI0024109D45|nr:hypothetical protein [Roseinatronobacter sp. S2]WFE75211.1 hypothetical protein P8S53_02040 [Roseinatronobacter sp. S2]